MTPLVIISAVLGFLGILSLFAAVSALRVPRVREVVEEDIEPEAELEQPDPDNPAEAAPRDTSEGWAEGVSPSRTVHPVTSTASAGTLEPKPSLQAKKAVVKKRRIVRYVRRGRRRPMAASMSFLSCVMLLSLAALFLTLGFATQGFRALTLEERAAVVTVTERSRQVFDATFTFPDGRTETFALTGDELYVDAQIVKWTPTANMVGLHTAYELERVGGRYRLIDDEQTRPRSIYALSEGKPLDMSMVTMLERFPFLQRFVDAEYGSATFIPARGEARYEILVSTTGLLARRLE